MSSSGLQISGVDSVLKRLQSVRSRARNATRAAAEEAITFLEGKAKEILDAEVYSGNSDDPDPPDKSDGDSLYNAFKHAFNQVAGAVVIGDLVNTSDHAGFLENGTDDEGTGQHFVPVGVKGFLAWQGADGGYIYARKGHYVQGITPIRFLARALTENRAEVRAIFEKHLKNLG